MRPLKHLKLRNEEKMAIAEESLKRRDSSDMDQGRELFTHVGRPIIIANNALAVVVDKKDGQIIVRGKDQNERSISVDEFNAALGKLTGINSPLLFVGPSTDAPKNRDAKSNDRLTADEAIGERTGQLCFARAQKTDPMWPAELLATSESLMKTPV